MSALFRLEDFGTRKASVKRTFETWYERPPDDLWSERVKALLASKRTDFTLDEIEDLLAVFATSHHDCVLENPDDFHRLVVATHERLDARILKWDREILRLRTERSAHV